jgi:SAM-dependent methyltransferase
MMPPLTLNGWLRFDVIRRHLPTDAKTLLEIGCGQGAVGARLAGRFDYVGLEPDEDSFRVASARLERAGGRVLRGSLDRLESGRTFDLVCAFEVLEHLPDDTAVLREWVSRVSDGGHLLVSVPAGQGPLGPEDIRIGHFRRYTAEQIHGLLSHVGLRDVAVLHYGFPMGYLLDIARNALARHKRAPDASREDRTLSSGRNRQPPDRWGFLTATAAAPFCLLQRLTTRHGAGLVATGRRA